MATPKVNLNMPTFPEIEIRLEGQWVKVSSLINGMPASVKKGYASGITSVSRSILTIVRRAIRTSQPPPNSGVRWAPLAKPKPGQKGIYNLTGNYLRSVGVFQYKSRTVVGLPYNKNVPSKTGRSKKITLNQLAILLEHGSLLSGQGGIPQRPLWAPSYKSYGGNKKVVKVILRSIRRELIKRYGLNSMQIRQI
jgi:hypothetical protein